MGTRAGASGPSLPPDASSLSAPPALTKKPVLFHLVPKSKHLFNKH